MEPSRIVAVGLLTAADLQRLGDGFRSVFPVTESTDFDDLLRALDQLTRTDDRPPRGRT